MSFQNYFVWSNEEAIKIASIPFFECEDCGQWINMLKKPSGHFVYPRRNRLEDENGEIVRLCSECCSECNHCNKIFRGTEEMCPDCEENTVTCSNCGELTRNQVGMEVSGEWYSHLCDDCRNDTEYCPDCGQHFWQNDDTWAYGRNGYCSNCSRRDDEVVPIESTLRCAPHDKFVKGKYNKSFHELMERFYRYELDISFCHEVPEEKWDNWKEGKLFADNTESAIKAVDTFINFVYYLQYNFRYSWEGEAKRLMDKLSTAVLNIDKAIFNREGTYHDLYSFEVMSAYRNAFITKKLPNGSRLTKKINGIIDTINALITLPETGNPVTWEIEEVTRAVSIRTLQKWMVGETKQMEFDWKYGFSVDIIRPLLQFNSRVGSCQNESQSDSYGWGFGSLATSDMGLFLLYDDEEIVGRTVVRYFWDGDVRYAVPDRFYIMDHLANMKQSIVSSMYRVICGIEPHVLVQKTTRSGYDTTPPYGYAQGDKVLKFNEVEGGRTLYTSIYRPIADCYSPDYDSKYLPSYYHDCATATEVLEHNGKVMCVDVISTDSVMKVEYTHEA